MRKIISILASALAVLTCSRAVEWEPVSVPERAPAGGRVVHFRAVQTDTRAEFGTGENGTRPTLWTANDTEVKLSLNYGGAIAAGITPSKDHRTATFDATFDFTGIDGPYTFYSVSPASAAYALSPSREAWKVSIPCVQTPSATSVDERGIILAAASIPYPEATTVSEVDLYFNHLTAYGRMSLVNLDLPENAAVSTVELTTTTPIVGDWYWHTSGTSITDYGASSTLTINTSRTSDIWFACAPVSVDGEMMTVTVYTTAGSFEQMVEFPAGASFEAGRAAVFTVDMDGAEFTPSEGGNTMPGSDFTLVTDASTLQTGDEVLIVYTAGSKALGSLSDNGNFRNPVDVTISGNAISSPGDATILTLAAGSTEGTWAFRDGSNYLASASSGNYLKNSSSLTSNASWTISITGSGEATIQAQAGNSTYLRYNANNNGLRFACYSASNSQSAVSLYRRSSGGGTVSTADPMLSLSDYGAYLGTGQEWILESGKDQVTRAYDANGVLTYTLIDADEVEELEITGYTKSKTKGSRFTVSVHWRKGFATLLSTTYSVTLVKEEGPKVWLSDGTGHGFIIKK
jgi:hypothetical protein